MKKVLLLLLVLASSSSAQTKIEIAGAQNGFPVAVPRLCDKGEAGDFATKIPALISKNLNITGLFKVIAENRYLEAPGKCVDSSNVAFSDWSIIGAEGLVKGEVESAGFTGGVLKVKLYLFDVVQQRPVIGKRYEVDKDTYQKVAHKFSNEIVKYFTGENGIFGSKVAFISQVGRFKELFTVDIDGTNLRQITRDKGLAVSPEWTPDGEKILFTSYRSRKPDLYLIDADGTGISRLGQRDGLELGATYSPDGKRIIASTSVFGVSDIVLMDLRGRLLKKVTNLASIDVSPSWAPDGERIAFCSNRGGGPQIYTQNINGGRAERISFTESKYCTSPSWSPKGDKIVYVCRMKGGNQLFMSSVDGRQITQMTFAGNNEDPAWSPDGKYLIYSSNMGKPRARQITVLPFASGIPQQITAGLGLSGQPAWSPVPDL